MKLPKLFKSSTPHEFHVGKIIRSGKHEKATSKAGSGDFMRGTWQERVEPRIKFKERQNFYLSVGRVQNVTESIVLDIINREWFYDAGDEDSDVNDKAVELMEGWEETVNISALFAKMVRSWIINGVHIISPKDWVPLQMQSIIGKARDDFGATKWYIQQIHGVETRLPAEDFLEIPYIELDREAWPVGMFDALMNVNWLDIDGNDPQSSLALYRQALQDNMKIHHKYASPRVVYTAPSASPDQIDNDLTPMIEAMKPGDRIVINEEIDIKQETVDGNARFIEHVNKIIDEIESGLGSSVNRLITEPSAMADAREAGAQDDDRVMGIMERLRMFMNKEVIPRITGLPPGEVVFKWGAKDTFTLELPEAIEKAINLKLIAPEQAIVMLQENFRWKIPTIEEAMETLGITPEVPEEPQQENPPTGPDTATTAPDRKRQQEEQSVKTESIKAETKLKNEKIVFIDNLTRKLSEV